MDERPSRPVPVTEDIDTGAFFAAAARGELTVCVCTSCGDVKHAPTLYCASCSTFGSTWKPVAGTGTVYTWTVVEHPTHPSFEVPYTAVLVQLDDAPVRLVGHLPGRPPLTAGQPMRVRFDQRPDGTVVPDWEPA